MLGAGPSLDTSIGWLLERREDLFVIAVSRISGKLRRLGIRPDVVVAIDPLDILHDVSKEGFLWEDVPLVKCPSRLPGAAAAVARTAVLPRAVAAVAEPGRSLARQHRRLRSDGQSCRRVAGRRVGLRAHPAERRRSLLRRRRRNPRPAAGVERPGRLPAVPLRRVGDDLRRASGGHVAAAPAGGGTVRADRPDRQQRTVPRLVNLARDAARVEAVPYRATSDVEPPVGASRDRRSRKRCRSLPPHTSSGCVASTGAPGTASARSRAAATRRCACSTRWTPRPTPPAPRRDVAGSIVCAAVSSASTASGSPCSSATPPPSCSRPSGPGGLDGVDDAGRRDWGRRYFRVLGRTAARFLELVESSDARARLRLAELDAAPDVDELLNRWESDGTSGRASLSPGPARRVRRVAARAGDGGAARDDGRRLPRRRDRDPRHRLRARAPPSSARPAQRAPQPRVPAGAAKRGGPDGTRRTPARVRRTDRHARRLRGGAARRARRRRRARPAAPSTGARSVRRLARAGGRCAARVRRPARGRAAARRVVSARGGRGAIGGGESRTARGSVAGVRDSSRPPAAAARRARRGARETRGTRPRAAARLARPAAGGGPVRRARGGRGGRPRAAPRPRDARRRTTADAQADMQADVQGDARADAAA